MIQDIYKPTGFLHLYKLDIEPRMLELAAMRHSFRKINVKYINCEHDVHDFSKEYTGHNDDMVMYCNYCSVKYHFEDDGYGDFSGASDDDGEGR